MLSVNWIFGLEKSNVHWIVNLKRKKESIILGSYFTLFKVLLTFWIYRSSDMGTDCLVFKVPNLWTFIKLLTVKLRSVAVFRPLTSTILQKCLFTLVKNGKWLRNLRFFNGSEFGFMIYYCYHYFYYHYYYY